VATLWHGRFDDGPADALLAFSVSLPVDRRLAVDDIAGSRAHVRGLGRVGLLDEDEVDAVLGALDRVELELAADELEFAPSDEDIHTAIERRVTELAGEAGGKLHTGRSRNDQVVTALRLWTRRELVAVHSAVLDLAEVFAEAATEAGDARLPGYTHLQRAQPVLLAHHLLAHGWALGRDAERIRILVDRLDVSTLGAGALAGSSLPLDPVGNAAELGFGATFRNSLDAVSDRDFVAEALFDLALLGIHLSRFGEEVVLFASDEFGYLKLHDSWSTGSSMMPQKKNPDIAELARGKAGRLVGNLTSLLVTLKGLPLAYNRDLQEDKEPLFDSVDQLRLALPALCGLLATATWDHEAMAEAADTPAAAATDLAEMLVADGVAFREAHALVGALVRRSLEEGTPLARLVAEEPRLGERAAAVFGPGASVARRTTPGAGGPAVVPGQLEAFRADLAAARAWPGSATAGS
jgi:argininosuccinate lyase